MVGRLAQLEALKNHPWIGRVYRKLTAAELVEARGFIAAHDGLAKDAFQMAVNRMHMDNPSKPKHWKEIQELLSCCNSASGPASGK